MRIVLQKLLIVVGLDHKRMDFAQTLDHQLCRIPEVGDESQTARAGVESKANRIDCIMRHGKSLDANVADRKLRAGTKNPPVTMSIQAAITPARFRGERIGINWQVIFAAKNFQPANMITMLVGEQNAIELIWGDAALLEAEDNLPRAQPTVDQQSTMIGGDQCAVPRAATPEHGQTEHGS